LSSVSPSSQSWFFRYKLYHIPFWLAYHYLWWIVTLGNPVKVWHALLMPPYAIKFGFYVIFQALAAYFNLYFLIPRYLEKSRFAPYAAYLVLTIVGATLCIVGGYYFSAYATGRSLSELYADGSDAWCFYSFLGSALPSTVASMTLAMSIKLAKNWIQARRRQQLLEKERLETELAFLRNQFNPHFLFNTINSIFFLIHKNPDKASSSLAKFSGLLRYQLYECNDRQIPLEDEVSYLSNFIELEKLRQDESIEISCELPEVTVGHVGIAPFVLLSFVENAFKHVSRHTDQRNRIEIRLALDGKQLYFYVFNTTIPEIPGRTAHPGGLGLKNVQRRLDLLYADQHELIIEQEPGYFRIQLHLILSELPSFQRFSTLEPNLK